MILAQPTVRCGRVVEQLEIRDQPQLVESAAKRFAVVAIQVRAQEIPRLSHRIRPAPPLLPEELQSVPYIPLQGGGDALQQLLPKHLVGVPDGGLFEGRAAE